MKKEKSIQAVEKILEQLKVIDDLASDSRGCYENARGNDSDCYSATETIRKLLEEL